MKISRNDDQGVVDIANCLILLNKVGESCKTNKLLQGGGAFKCKTCNKQFLSFQALGGHRASQKKVKLMGAQLSHQLPNSTINMKRKIHICSICGVEFSIGQALGGHMRKHRGSSSDGLLNRHDHVVTKSGDTKGFNLCLDLNLTTPFENELKLNLGIARKE